MMGEKIDFRLLLGEGLNLCVRARKLDDAVQKALAIGTPDNDYETKCGTLAVWVHEQYERDLADWERRVRHALMQGETP